MNTLIRRAPEVSQFQDQKTGYTIWRLTNSGMEDKHTYYDLSPWSPDRRYILFSTARPEDLTIAHRDTMATDRGEVYVLDTENCQLTKIADNAFYNTHTGAFPLWHPTKNKVYFYTGPDRVARVDVAEREIEQTMRGSIRQLSPDGQKFAYTTNDLEQKTERGVYTMNEDGSDVQLIAPLEELYALTPNKDLFDISTMTVGNTKWHPDGQDILVAMWVWERPHVQDRRFRRSLYIVKRDGSEIRWLTFFGHHHSWTPDGRHVLYSGYKRYEEGGIREEPRLYLVRFDGSDTKLVIDEPLGGHPITSPDSRMITTWDDQSVLLVRLDEKRVERIATLHPSFDMSHRGTHPHCIWSPDGKQILYNSAQSGHSQLYLISVE